jgi:hypothetical protein
VVGTPDIYEIRTGENPILVEPGYEDNVILSAVYVDKIEDCEEKTENNDLPVVYARMV